MGSRVVGGDCLSDVPTAFLVVVGWAEIDLVVIVEIEGS